MVRNLDVVFPFVIISAREVWQSLVSDLKVVVLMYLQILKVDVTFIVQWAENTEEVLFSVRQTECFTVWNLCGWSIFPWMEIVYMALDSSYLVWVLKAFIIEEVIWQISLLLLEKQKCKKTVICFVFMSGATTSFPKMLKDIVVCISE